MSAYEAVERSKADEIAPEPSGQPGLDLATVLVGLVGRLIELSFDCADAVQVGSSRPWIRIVSGKGELRKVRAQVAAAGEQPASGSGGACEGNK